MNKSIYTILTGFVLVILIVSSGRVYSQTSGTLTFTVNLTSHNAGYGLEHVTAIWVENASMAFVKTKYRMASGHTLNNHLPVWKANSASNVVDATTGSTLNSYSPITVIWNATNVSAALVPDGVYRVMVEFTWDDGSSNHDTTSVKFTKGTSAVHLTPANKTNFTNMVLDWAPTTSSVKENDPANASVSIFPNPTNGMVNIDFKNTDGGYNIEVVDLAGSLVYKETLEKGASKLKTIDLSRCANGIYFVRVQKDTLSKAESYKIVLSK